MGMSLHKLRDLTKDREAWCSAVHGVTKSQTWLSQWQQYSTVYMYHSFFIHSFVGGHRDCFHVLAIVNSVAVNTEVQVSFSIMVFSGYMPSSGIAASYCCCCCCCCSGTKSYLTLCDPIDHTTPSFLVLHSELAQTHGHWVGGAIQPSHLLLPPFPPALNLS